MEFVFERDSSMFEFDKSANYPKLFVMKEKGIRYEQPQMTVVRFQQQARILSGSHVTKGKDLEWGD